MAMNNDPKRIGAKDPEYPDISDEVKGKMRSALQKMMEVGLFVVYGQADEGIPDGRSIAQQN